MTEQKEDIATTGQQRLQSLIHICQRTRGTAVPHGEIQKLLRPSKLAPLLLRLNVDHPPVLQ